MAFPDPRIYTPPWVSSNTIHVGIGPELIVTTDRDVMGFFPGAALGTATEGMTISSDSGGGIGNILWKSDPFVTTTAGERILTWGRVSGNTIVSGFRWVPYCVNSDFTETAILPLREVYAPRIVYDKTSNMLQLWFWTNIIVDPAIPEYNTVTAYDEKLICPFESASSSNAKRVLCFATGQLGHYYVKGGFMGPFAGLTPSGSPPSSFATSQFDLVPLFSRPIIVSNATYASSPGIVSDSSSSGMPSYTFRHQMLSANEVRIFAGTVRIHGRGNYRIPANPAMEGGDITISGLSPWVSVEFNRINGTGIIIMTNTEPVSDGGFLRVPLLSFTSLEGGGYASPTVHQMGDINVDTAA